MVMQCPSAGDSNLPCCGIGKCVPSSGSCECFEGAFGADCGECAPGYFRKGGMCVPRPDSIFVASPAPPLPGGLGALAPTAPQANVTTDGSSGPSLVVLAGAGGARS